MNHEETLAYVAYTLAAEKADELAKRYRRIAWWIPWSPLLDTYLCKAQAYADKAQQFRDHLRNLGHGAKTRRKYERGELESVSIGRNVKNAAF